MDFKVAGTKDGITALQMDIKVPNVTHDNHEGSAGAGPQGAGSYILDKMIATIDKPRETMSPYAPRIFTMQIPTDKIRELIGPGGKVIRGIVEATGCQDRRRRRRHREHLLLRRHCRRTRASRWSPISAAVAEVGKTYLGKVVRIVDFGAFVEIFPGTDGLLHISEISESRIKQVRDELNEGDQILVKVLALEGNKIKLSRKAILKEQREKLKAGAGTAE